MVQSPSWEANWFAASQETPRILTWRLMFRSYGGPTHSYVTSPQDRSPQDRYLTSHRYSARPTRLPSPTDEPAPEALLTRSEFPFTIHYVKGPDVVTSIHCYNRHVWSYSFFVSMYHILSLAHDVNCLCDSLCVLRYERHVIGGKRWITGCLQGELMEMDRRNMVIAEVLS